MLGNGLLLNDFVLARCAVDYRSPLTQDDGDVDVELRCTRVGRSSVTTAERMIAVSDGRLAAEAEAVLVHYDWKTGKSRPLTDEIAHRVRPLAARLSPVRSGLARRRAPPAAR